MNQPVDDEHDVEIMVETIDRFFDEVDFEDFESEDLARTLLRVLRLRKNES